MLNPILNDKWRASVIHFVLSGILALLCFILVFFLLYPAPLAQATGVENLFILMLAIDVVLGPALTFIVYKKYKKTLKMDLLIIVIIQLSALIYGIYAMYQGRPVWIAYTADRFELIRANDMIEESLDYPLPVIRPKYIFVETKPQDPKEQLKIMLEEVQSNISIAQQPQYYRPISQAKHQIQQQALSLAELQQYNSKVDVEKTLAKYPNADTWLPLKANAVDMVVLINKEKAEVIKIVDLRPWN
ncbi:MULTISPECIES: TfpX/TfpZ family type IV pilin accessory protein [unclassified Acinetobacter]|uniref:TfpX/TfpZ family type IV pilin accessory protein n=1 Tax=unclassified Acinetobacter TaxID=196816 RepID=UPI0015D27627|nr:MULTISPECIES: TfpX/TfpZ family type IV pilin accessory protein [unclassified Acinetobacter]